MDRDRIPLELYREYRRVRNLGGLFDLVIPLIAAIAVVLLSGADIVSHEEQHTAGPWLKYGLVAFSVTVCIVARIIFGRLMATIRNQAKRGVYRPGRVIYSYLILYFLYLVPSLWGFTYFVLTGGMMLFLILVALTMLAFLFCTPHIGHYLQ